MWGWYGYGCGWGRGSGRGMGRGWWAPYGYRTPQGYTYVGPCRCGFGPRAFYTDDQGRLLHASQVWGWGGWTPWTPGYAPSQSEAKTLKAEKADLENRLKEIEERLKGLES